MGYFKELYDKPVQRPSDDVAVININQVGNKSKHLIFKRKTALFSSYNLKIKNEKGKTVYKGKREYNYGPKYKICNLDNTVNFSIKECDKKEARKNIYLGKNKDKPISRILYGESNRKYVIEFTNLITERTEYLEMSSDARLVVCGIFYGREEEGAPLITKITRDKYNRTKCTLDIAPGVDALFMVGLAAFFSDRLQFKSKRKVVKTERSISSIPDKNKSITDNNYKNNYYYYWIDTVSISTISDNDVDADIDADDYNKCGYEHYAHCDTNAFDVCGDGYHDGYGGWGGDGGDGGWGGDGGDGGWGGDCGGDCGGGDCGGGGD